MACSLSRQQSHQLLLSSRENHVNLQNRLDSSSRNVARESTLPLLSLADGDGNLGKTPEHTGCLAAKHRQQHSTMYLLRRPSLAWLHVQMILMISHRCSATVVVCPYGNPCFILSLPSVLCVLFLSRAACGAACQDDIIPVDGRRQGSSSDQQGGSRSSRGNQAREREENHDSIFTNLNISAVPLHYHPLIFAHTSRPTPIKHFEATHSAFNLFWPTWSSWRWSWSEELT